MHFLNYDSTFMTAVRKLVDYFLLGVMWLFVSMLGVTFGAATTAMLYTAEKSINKDEGKMFVTFWKCFRREFKQATILWVIGLLCSGLLVFNGMLLWGVELPALFFSLILVASLITLCWMSLWFGYLSRFADSIRVLLGNTFRMVFVYLPKVALLTIVTAAAVVLSVVSFVYMLPVLLMVPGVYAMIANILFRKIFKAFLPEEAVPLEEGDDDYDDDYNNTQV